MLDTILNVVLWLLSFLGITLLVVLGIVVLVLLIVLFVPIHYKGEFTKNPEVMQIQIKINWLLHIVRVYVNYKKELLIKAFVLFFKVYDSNKPTKVKKKAKEKHTEEDISKEENNIVYDDEEEVLSDNSKETINNTKRTDNKDEPG